MRKFLLIAMSVLLTVTVGACASVYESPKQSPAVTTTGEKGMDAVDNTYIKRDGVEVIYVAGGCFWGTEKLMQTIHGVINATSGYANGQEGDVPAYATVSDTGFKETVRVEYDPDQVSLDTILFAFFRSIDPTVTNRQGNDVGSQYQAGVYWSDDKAKETVMRIADVERGRYDDFAVEIEPLRNFYDAEEYHQNYLDKNINGYCHISFEEFERVRNIIVDPADYPRPSIDEIKAALTDVQYNITQDAGTEPPFQNEYWNSYERGIYVDIVTGEPLFSSGDKIDSGTGWPSFSKGIDENTFVYLTDDSLGMDRIEVRSRSGNTHLGHIFYGETESPTGIRFCINSAALRFVAYDDMEKEGYGYLTDYA
ncbi:MAG: peptide-methionine (R)-S-oxide reductase MsrB [Clostridiaceae bacterium]|nr:peptide-methionine (R)-S-oxide reductase MsrB [Clostridiaceae bacterium]